MRRGVAWRLPTKAVNRPGEAVARNAFHAPGAFADDAGEDAQGGGGGERARGAELVGAAAAFCFPEACEVERLPVSKVRSWCVS